MHYLAETAADVLDKSYEAKPSVPEIDDIAVDEVARKVLNHFATGAKKDLWKNFVSPRFWLVYLKNPLKAKEEITAVREFVTIGQTI